MPPPSAECFADRYDKQHYTAYCNNLKDSCFVTAKNKLSEITQL
jgi:hypothetical protein